MTEAERFRNWFHQATGHSPYHYQTRLATERDMPGLLRVPTGLGKTAAAILAWLWRRRFADERVRAQTPRRLVYCLPMRVLVEQTRDFAVSWVGQLEQDEAYAQSMKHPHKIAVSLLMGGEDDGEWDLYPERDAILIGTQDMLLSRALNRGYGMSRFEWPVHFGLLNQDCHWVVDETQLMGPGLWTTSQLDWMRSKRFTFLKPCCTTWMSATVGTGFLATADRENDDIGAVVPFEPRLHEDDSEELRCRRSAHRRVQWFEPSTGKRAPAIHQQIAKCAHREHHGGTLTLVVCNTVEMAQRVFGSLPDAVPKILLTSRFRRSDRLRYEQHLVGFEARRAESASGRLQDDPGLVCVSTQVVEAGLDISARCLWSELAPWPSVIQRLGRLNRDGRDQEAVARFWETPNREEQKREGVMWVGPYPKRDLDSAKTLVGALAPLSLEMSFTNAVEKLEESHRELLDRALQVKPAPLPRALDVHGLFSTERDVHGGFTDVSAFVRGLDPDADLTVFWRTWSGASPPRGEALDGPSFEADPEGCPVAFYRVSEMLEARGARAWLWNDEDERWEPCAPRDLRPGMVLMLHRDVGGYDARFGWTGAPGDVLGEVPRAGRGRGLKDDEQTETGCWASLDVHSKDVRAEAERLCDAVGLREDDQRLKPFRMAVVEAAGLHDLGKVHPKWQSAMPAGSAVDGGPWAKCPRVLGVDVPLENPPVAEAVVRLRPGSLRLCTVSKWRGGLRLRWAVGRMLTRKELEQLRGLPRVRWAGHVPFRPGMRHEAASALAMWRRYREGRAPYPALAVYLAAAHHGKVRTALRATSAEGHDVFGVPADPDALDVAGQRWPLDFSVAADGAAGEWREGGFILTDHGWTGLVADLLGPWRKQGEDRSDVGAVPEHEPRRLGPFVLAWLEALVRVADWRASDRPSRSLTVGEVAGGE